MSDLTKAYLAYYGIGIIGVGVAATGLSLVVYNVRVPGPWHRMAQVRLVAFNALVISGVFAALLILVRSRM